MRKYLLVSFFLLASLIQCTDSKKTQTSEFSATIDGNPWKASFASCKSTNHRFMILASQKSDDSNFNISFPDYLPVGSYNLSDTTIRFLYTIQGQAYLPDRGNVTITNIDHTEKTISGTFLAIDPPGLVTKGLHISEGKFTNLKYSE